MKKNLRGKKFYQEDFKEQFGIAYHSHNKVMAPELFSWDINCDKEYSINPRLNEKLTEKYGALLAEGYTAPMYITWVNKMVEYGVFAEADIKRGDMVAEYTGMLGYDDANNDNPYVWDYPTIRYVEVPEKKRKKKIKYCIDAEKSGNYSRFINHTHRKHQNVGIHIVPANNFWHVVYVAQKDIYRGQQLLTYYGTQYWRDRQIVPAPLLP
jgi:SET domain-containing protein